MVLEESGTLSIPKCPIKGHILGIWNHCSHPWTRLWQKWPNTSSKSGDMTVQNMIKWEWANAYRCHPLLDSPLCEYLEIQVLQGLHVSFSIHGYVIADLQLIETISFNHRKQDRLFLVRCNFLWSFEKTLNFCMSAIQWLKVWSMYWGQSSSTDTYIRIWDTLHTKLPTERAYLRHVESLTTPLHYIVK